MRHGVPDQHDQLIVGALCLIVAALLLLAS